MKQESELQITHDDRRTHYVLSALFRATWVVAAALLFSPSPAGAALYLETGIGAGQFIHAQSIFPTLANPSGFGLGTNITFANAFGTANSLVQVHLGAQLRMTEVGSGGTTYGLMSLYPAIRLETSRMFIGFGVSPLVRKTENTTGNFVSGYQSMSGALGAYGEAALLWRIVPYFHLALGGSAEVVRQAGNLSPSPALQITLNMRFFIGEGQSKGSSGRKYDGWRYPFGIELF